MKNQKWTTPLTVTLGTVGGLAMMGTGAYLLWNSKQMKMMRTVKRVEKILGRTGAALQSVSEIL